MRYFFPGLIAGALAALLLFEPAPGTEIRPEWWSTIKNITALEKSPQSRKSNARFFVKANDRDYFLLASDGGIAASGTVSDGLSAFSGGGEFYVKYQKVGSDIEFYNAKGERFWKVESQEYPYLSHNGRLILLMNGDHTVIRMVDYNGNILGTSISGRTCTAISFSDRNDYAGAGFLDGSYYFVGDRGRVTGSGMAPQGSLVKGVAVSVNGRHAAVHYGNNQKDYIRIINCESGDYDLAELAHAHQVKTSMHVNDGGYCAVIDVDRILYISDSGKVKMTIGIPPKRPGHSSISYVNGVYAASYTMQTGASKLILFREDGVILFSREFPAEAFLDASLQDGLVFLRGSDNIFCYSLHGI
jgi:hypothetical protein